MAKINLDRAVLDAEHEIDDYHLTHPLLKIKKVEALWHLMSVAEERMVILEMNQDNLIFVHNFTDYMKFVLKDCLKWLNDSCHPGGQIPSKSNPNLRRLAGEFLNIGFEYQNFAMMYTLAYKGFRKIKAENKSLIVNFPPNHDPRYGAYNELMFPESFNQDTDDSNDVSELQLAVLRNFKMGEGFFSYSLKPKDVINGMNHLRKYTWEAYELPPTWTFSNYSLSEFEEIYTALSSLSLYHTIAYKYALVNSSHSIGFNTNIIKFKYIDMVNKISRYTGVKKNVIRNILNDLTYGNRAQRHPDPALQPIIPLTKEQYAIIPSILVSNNPERNLIVLLNRMPEENKIYSKISNENESLMRDKIKSELTEFSFRFWNGKIVKKSDIPDLDLAIISESEKIVLICELKWFLDPAETRELIEKSKAITKGIKQVKKLEGLFNSDRRLFDDKLNVDSTYNYTFIVISENFIGLSSVQDKDIPVINRPHLLKKIKDNQSLKKIVSWLKQRDYLPKENIHFKIHTFKYEVGNWSISNIGFKPLLRDSLIHHL